MKGHIVPTLQITQLYSSILLYYHLAALDGCGRPELTCCSACFPAAPMSTPVYFPLCVLSLLHLLCSYTIQLLAGLYLSATSSQPSSGCADTTKVCTSTLSYPAGRPKHRSNLVLAENGLISAGGDQERGRRE